MDRLQWIKGNRYRRKFKSGAAMFGLAVALCAVGAGWNASPVQAATITFQTEAGRPRIVSTTPTNRATGVLPSINPITITFDQPMNTGTLNTTNIKLVSLSTGEIPASWVPANVTATSTTFQTTNSLGLESGQTYALILTTGVQSAAGKTLDPTDPLHRSGTLFGEAWVLEFSTGVALNTTAIATTNIGNKIAGATGGQTEVPVNAVIRINFERAMTSSTINTTTVTLAKSGGTTVPVTVIYDAVANTAVITPTSPLEYSTSYTLTLTGLQDILGNPLP